MNLADVKTRVKRQFGDEAAVQITDDDIVRWVNDGQRDIVLHNETILQKSSLTSSVAAQQNYALPTDLLVLRNLHWKPTSGLSFYRLEGMSFNEFEEYIDGWDGNNWPSTDPSTYTVYENAIRLFPVPMDSGTNNIKLYYTRRPVDLTQDSDEIDLPIEYHNAIVSYCLTKAYELDEDWGAASALAQQKTEDIKMNRERENWGHQDVYPSITTRIEDYW